MSDKVIDLCSDSEEEDDFSSTSTFTSKLQVSAAKMPAKTKNIEIDLASNSPMVTQSQPQEDDGYDSDESLMNSKPVFAKKPAAATDSSVFETPKKAAPKSSAAAARSSKVTPASGVASLKPPPDYASSTTATAAHSNVGTRVEQNNDASPFQYPALLANSTMYPDLRERFILAFWQCARNRTQNSYDSTRLDQLVRKVVLLALRPDPIRSVEELCFAKHAGGHCGSLNVNNSRVTEVKVQLQEGGFDYRVVRPTPAHETKRYCSVVEACLVAMLTESESRLVQKGMDPSTLKHMDDESLREVLSEKDMWISLSDLLPAIDALLKPECPGRLTRRGHADNGAAFYLERSTKSAEFLQICKLETDFKELSGDDLARIKRHCRKEERLFELTHAGFHSAVMIREREFPLPASHYRSSRIQYESQVLDAFKNICIGVDICEGGGPAKSLHGMCNRLDSTMVPYFVASLKVGDYMFFTRDPSGKLNYVCPILVERKSYQDVAASIHDGRWKKQKLKMYQAQYVLGYDTTSRLVYIIEGDAKSQQVTGGFVGRSADGIHIDEVEREIELLESEGFEVLRTASQEQSMLDLARWAKKVAADIQSGKLKADCTYAELIDELKTIPPCTDFSRLAKEAKARRTEASVAAASKRARTEIDYDSDIEVVEEVPARPLENPRVRRSLESDFFQARPAASHGASPAKKAKSRSDDGSNTNQYSGMKVKELQQKCVEVGLPKSGTKGELVARLNGPHPPAAWLRRKNAGQKLPTKYNGAGTALLVALYLHEKEAGDDNRGLTKDELIFKADELQISEHPILAQVGLYTGWSTMGEMQRGDPPLVKMYKTRYKLTRNSDIAGYPVAEGMHKWCHEWNVCQCGATDL